jgi:putative ABC transport system ATP-binding protein
MADRALAQAVTRELAGPTPALQLRDVHFAWLSAPRFAIGIAAFQVASGERVLLVGPSGSGKSTLLSLMCGVLLPDRGSVEVLGGELTKLSAAARDRFRGEHFGILFQQFNLLPYASILDNVVLPLRFAPARRARATALRSAAQEATHLLESLGIDAATARAGKAARLSVGQQQRVAAARALIGSPEIVVADEPTSSLDRDRQQGFLDLLFAEVARVGATLLMVSHDTALANRFDRVVRIDDIAVVERGA